MRTEPVVNRSLHPIFIHCWVLSQTPLSSVPSLLLYLDWRRIILVVFRGGKLCEWDCCCSPHLKGHAGLLAKFRRLSLHPVLSLLELVQTQRNVSNTWNFSVVQVHSYFIKNVFMNTCFQSVGFVVSQFWAHFCTKPHNQKPVDVYLQWPVKNNGAVKKKNCFPCCFVINGYKEDPSICHLLGGSLDLCYSRIDLIC